jgi:hypothetical protein
MDAALLQSEVFVGAARVTAAYAIMFASLVLWQGLNKLRIAAACAKTKEKFDRYAEGVSCFVHGWSLKMKVARSSL